MGAGQYTLPLFGTAITGLFLLWTTSSLRLPLQGAMQASLMTQKYAAVGGFLLCILGESLTFVAPDLSYAKFIPSLFGALGLLMFSTLMPRDLSFMRRARVRLVVIAGVVAAAIGLGVLMPHPEIHPVLWAAIIFHQQGKTIKKRLNDHYQEMTVLQEKLIALESERQSLKIKTLDPAAAHTSYRAS